MVRLDNVVNTSHHVKGFHAPIFKNLHDDLKSGTQGMAFIHNSSLRSHGNLTSDHCLIDNRWMLKITGFGLRRIRNLYMPETEIGDYQKYKGANLEPHTYVLIDLVLWLQTQGVVCQ